LNLFAAERFFYSGMNAAQCWKDLKSCVNMQQSGYAVKGCSISGSSSAEMTEPVHVLNKVIVT